MNIDHGYLMSLSLDELVDLVQDLNKKLSTREEESILLRERIDALDYRLKLSNLPFYKKWFSKRISYS